MGSGVGGASLRIRGRCVEIGGGGRGRVLGLLLVRIEEGVGAAHGGSSGAGGGIVLGVRAFGKRCACAVVVHVRVGLGRGGGGGELGGLVEGDAGWIERVWGGLPGGGLVERALQIVWLMVATSAGCGDGGTGAEGCAAGELVECAGEIGRGGVVLIEEMCDAGLAGRGGGPRDGLRGRGRGRCCGVEIGRPRRGLGSLCGGREGLEMRLRLPAGEVKVVVGGGHVGELRFGHGRKRRGRRARRRGNCVPKSVQGRFESTSYYSNSPKIARSASIISRVPCSDPAMSTDRNTGLPTRFAANTVSRASDSPAEPTQSLCH
jgi:hypothetical protein